MVSSRFPVDVDNEVSAGNEHLFFVDEQLYQGVVLNLDHCLNFTQTAALLLAYLKAGEEIQGAFSS